MNPKEKNQVNAGILAEKIRLIDENGEKLGIVSRDEALSIASDRKLDLVQMAITEGIAACRIMDHSKHLYDKKKKVQAQRKKQRQKNVTVKEIKFRPNTDVGDYQIKLNKIKLFLANGNKVKISLRFKGREMMHQDLGTSLLHRVENDLEDVAVVEQPFKLEGRQMLLLMAPKK